MIANAAFCLACLVATLALRQCLKKENIDLEVSEAASQAGLGQRDEEIRPRKEDGFRYIL